MPPCFCNPEDYPTVFITVIAAACQKRMEARRKLPLSAPRRTRSKAVVLL
jgi:hypothetical protein